MQFIETLKWNEAEFAGINSSSCCARKIISMKTFFWLNFIPWNISKAGCYERGKAAASRVGPSEKNKKKSVIIVDLMDEEIIDISMDLLWKMEMFNILILTHRCKHEAREGNDEVAQQQIITQSCLHQLPHPVKEKRVKIVQKLH